MINDKFSSWEEIIFVVPQGSIPGPLFCNIFLCDFFLFTNEADVANYADDNTPYASDNKKNSTFLLVLKLQAVWSKNLWV